MDEHPEATASTMVDWSGWPEGPDQADIEYAVEIDAPCTVTAVDPAADPIVTVLECDDEGVTRGLEITVAAAAAPVVWGVGDEVEVAYSRAQYLAGYGIRNNTLVMHRAADGEVLLHAIDEGSVDAFTPLMLSVDDERCLPRGDNDARNLVLGFDNQLGEVLELGPNQRGTITPPSGEGLLAIDVGAAYTGAESCCEQSSRVQLLLRRTAAE